MKLRIIIFAVLSQAVRFGSIRLTIALAGLVVVPIQSQAKESAAGTYRTITRWPTGIHEDMAWMLPSNKPMCDALATAANQTYRHKPFDVFSDEMPKSDELVPVSWERFPSADAYEIAARIVKSEWRSHYPKARSDDEAKLRELKEAMKEGVIWLESASVDHFGDTKGTTRIIRLHRNWHTDNKNFSNLFLGGEMAVADGAGFEHITPLTGLEGPETVATFQGRSYLLGRGERESDNSFKRIVPPQPQITLFDWSVPICRVVFWKSERR